MVAHSDHGLIGLVFVAVSAATVAIVPRTTAIGDFLGWRMAVDYVRGRFLAWPIMLDRASFR